MRGTVIVKFASATATTAVVQFVVAWAVLGANRDDYDPMSRPISALAEVGSPTRGAMSTSLIFFGLLVAPFAPALLRALPTSAVAPAAVLLNAAGSIGAGAFPCSPGCPGPAASTTDFAHIVAAFLAYLGLILAPLAMAWRLHRLGARPGLRRVSLLIGVLTLAGLLAWVVGVAGQAGGALQRVATTIGDAWYVITAIAMLQGGGELDNGPSRLDGRGSE